MRYLPFSILKKAPDDVQQLLLKSGVYGVNDCFLPLYESKAFRKHMFGGRGSGKSHHGTDYADWILETKTYARVLLLRYIKEDVRSSLWQSFKDGLENKNRFGKYDLADHNMSARHKKTGNILTSKGVKASKVQSAKLKSLAGYTHIIIEEADEIPKEDKRKLIDSVRKKGAEIEIIEMWNTAYITHHIYEDYNKVATLHEGYYRVSPKSDSGIVAMWSNYKDNSHNLNDVFIKRYEDAMQGTDINYIRTDVEGYIPSLNSLLVLPHFKLFKGAMPPCDRYIWGIDYGYTNDQTALVKVGIKARQRYFQELLYEPGISARAIYEALIKHGRKPEETLYSEVDKEMILQLRKLGVSVRQTKKGPGSKKAGILKSKEYECFYQGKNYEAEVKAWSYITTTDLMTGKTVVTNEPTDGNDHLCQAGLYAIYTDSFIVRAGYE